MQLTGLGVEEHRSKKTPNPRLGISIPEMVTFLVLLHKQIKHHSSINRDYMTGMLRDHHCRGILTNPDTNFREERVSLTHLNSVRKRKRANWISALKQNGVG